MIHRLGARFRGGGWFLADSVPMHVWSIAAEAAAQQHLILARWQLTSLGLSFHAIREHNERHGWAEDAWGVIWLPGPKTPLRKVAAAYLAFSKPAEAWTRVAVEDWGDDEAVADALVTAARESGVVICGPTAAWRHEMREHPDEEVWLLLGAHAGRGQRNGIHLRYGTVPSDAVQYIDGLPVLNAEHTIIDNARVRYESPVHRHWALVKLIRRADALRKTTPAKIDAVLATIGKARGKPALRDVLADLAGEFSHSQAEAQARALVTEVLAEFGLTLHPRPLDIWLDGVRVAEADLPVVEIRYDIEVDGPHHDLPEQQEKDRNRDRLARQAQWLVERFRVEFVQLQPRTFQAQVRQTVRERLTQFPRFSLESGGQGSTFQGKSGGVSGR